MLPIRGVSNTSDTQSMTLQGLANCIARLRIPGSNGPVNGSRYDVLPIGRISNGLHRASMPLLTLLNFEPKMVDKGDCEGRKGSVEI